VAIATLLWVGTRATGTTLAIHNDVVAAYCTSPYDALWMLSHLQVNVEPKAPQLRFSSSNPDPQPLWRFAAVQVTIALRRFPDKAAEFRLWVSCVELECRILRQLSSCLDEMGLAILNPRG
jgi:hypothetical protein